MTITCTTCGAHGEGAAEFVESLREIHALAQPDHEVVVTQTLTLEAACSR